MSVCAAAQLRGALITLSPTDINRLSNGTDTAISHNPDGSGKAPAHGASRKRILVLSVSPDASEQYVSIMNCIFAAQKRVSGRQ